MSPALTRRRALLGSAAAAIGVAVPVAVAATPATVPPVSPQAKALQDELARLSSGYRRSAREMDEASEATPEVEPPEAIFARPGDTGVLWRPPVKSWASPDRFWYGDNDLVERLRDDTFLTLAGTPSPGAARRDEIVAAWDRWQADVRSAEEASGFLAAEERYEAARDAYAEFRVRLVEMETGDPEVLIVKALAIADLCRGNERLQNSIEAAIREWGGAYEVALALSLARDFVSLLGADHREAVHG